MIGSRMLTAVARRRRPDRYPLRERLTEVIAWGIAIAAVITWWIAMAALITGITALVIIPGRVL